MPVTAVIGAITALLGALSEVALTHLFTIVQGASKAKDPERYLKRLATAAAAHEATKATVSATLKKTKAK